MTVHLPQLNERKRALETCVYCPKLCRGACPVSNADFSETLTPWGKMSSAYFLLRGDVADVRGFAETAWACTGCHACKGSCDHKNEVAGTLIDARADAFERGRAPEAALRAVSTFAQHTHELALAARDLGRGRAGSRNGVVIGCGYLLSDADGRALPEAHDALAVVDALVGEPVSVIDQCCGLPLLEAGDRPGFARAAEAFAAALAGHDRVVAVDPGCARTILEEYPRHGVDVKKPELLVDLAHDAKDRLQTLGGPVPRYHDPCQLGRGLGRYDQPRELLERLVGEAPHEFDRAREGAECSGGGGMLPQTYPAASAAIAETRIESHRASGGGTLVTACAGSLRRFRTAGETAEDLVTWLARGLGVSRDGS